MTKNLKDIAEENYQKYGIKVEEVEPFRRRTEFKIVRGLFQEVFSRDEDSFFWVEPLFIDICPKGDGKVPLRLRLQYTDNSEIFNRNYFNISSKHLEIYNRKYLNKAKDFINEYKKLFSGEIFLIEKF